MLRLPEFDLYQPESVEEAAELLAEHGTDARPISGGTDLFPKLKRGQFTPDVIVSLDGIDGLAGVDIGDDNTVIGGQTSVATIENHDGLREAYPALVEAADVASTPTLRKMGTVAGNLCQDTRCYYYDQRKDWRQALGWCMKAPDEDGYTDAGALDTDGDVDVPCRVAPGSSRCWAVFASDTAAPLIAHDASVTLVGADGEREVSLLDLYRDDGISHLDKRHDELLTEVRLPPADGVSSTYRKLSPREAFDFPSLGLAAAVQQDGDGVVERATIAMTGVASCPVVAEEAAAELEGERPTADRLETVGEAVAAGIRPLDNMDYHPAHRKRMASVYARRALDAVTA